MSDYADRPTKPRIFGEEDGTWSLDAIDPETGGYSESVWNFDTFGEALGAVGEFMEALRTCVDPKCAAES